MADSHNLQKTYLTNCSSILSRNTQWKMSSQQSPPKQHLPSLKRDRKTGRVGTAPSLFSVTTAQLSPCRAGTGAPAPDRPLRRPPAGPCWSCPCGHGDPHPQRPWDPEQRSFQAERRLRPGARQALLRTRERTGTGGKGAGPPAPEAPFELAARLGSRAGPACRPGAPALTHTRGQPTCAGLQEQPERGQVPRQQGEEAQGHAAAAGCVRRQRPAARHARASRTEGGGWAPSRPPTRGTRTPLFPVAAVRLSVLLAAGKLRSAGWCWGSPGAGSLPAARPSPPCGGPRAQQLLSLQAGGQARGRRAAGGAWGLGPPRPPGATPQVLRKQT